VLDVLIQGESKYVPFVARSSDCEAHGVRLFYEALYEHKYGEIADSDEERILRGEIPPPEDCQVIDGAIVNIAEIKQQVDEELNRRLSAYMSAESLAHAEIDAEYAAERKTKIAALLAVKQQPGYPLTVEFPEEN
jgi:hypothetical protein